jgi:hypothetical protein
MRLLAIALALLAACATTSERGDTRLASRDSRPPELIDLHDVIGLTDGVPAPSPKVLALAGARVRVRGWLVAFEEPLEDGFWLVQRPLRQDESGAGTGDLPARSVRVLAPEAVVRALPPDPAPLEATGRLEVGRAVDAEGRASVVRVVVEDPRDVSRLSAPR